jgi:hypothetical protein
MTNFRFECERRNKKIVGRFSFFKEGKVMKEEKWQKRSLARL